MLIVLTFALNRPTLLINAHILTMNREQPVAEALLVIGRRVAAIGSQSDLEKDLPLFVRVVDLQGLTALPEFVDAHSHFPSAGLAHAFLDLTPPPV